MQQEYSKVGVNVLLSSCNAKIRKMILQSAESNKLYYLMCPTLDDALKYITSDGKY